jgi:hypothetical protein
MRISDNQSTQKHSSEFMFYHISEYGCTPIDDDTPQYILDALIRTTEKYRCFYFKIEEGENGFAYIEGFDRGIEYRCETKAKMYDVLKALIETRKWKVDKETLAEAFNAIESLNISE